MKLNRNNKTFRSPRRKKVLLLLAAGLTLSLTRSPKQYFRVVKATAKAWREINKEYLKRLIKEFHHERLVDYREETDGTITVVISEAGRQQVLRFDIDKLTIKKAAHWDGKWRVIFFDIPEKKRRVRDALRDKLVELDFQKLQKSVFICPYPCFDELNFIIEFFDARSYVRLAELTNLNNEAELILRFKLR